jgi:hypothetical protein
MPSLDRLTVSNDNVDSYFYPGVTPYRTRPVGSPRVSDSEELGPYASFGQWLREQRLAARFRSQPQAELAATKRGLRLINQGKLSHIERGMNSNPDPAFLSEIATLYRLDYPALVQRWMTARYGVDIDATNDQPTAAPSVQPEPLHAVPSHDDQNRPVPSEEAITVAVRELRAALREARELAHLFRAATAKAALEKARRQVASTHTAAARRREGSRKRRG